MKTNQGFHSPEPLLRLKKNCYFYQFSKRQADKAKITPRQEKCNSTTTIMFGNNV